MNSISLLNLNNVFATVLQWHHLGDGARGIWLGQGECCVSISYLEEWVLVVGMRLRQPHCGTRVEKWMCPLGVPGGRRCQGVGLMQLWLLE